MNFRNFKLVNPFQYFFKLKNEYHQNVKSFDEDRLHTKKMNALLENINLVYENKN